MIAADTSTWIAFLEGDGGEDVELLDRALQDRQVLMAPVVLTVDRPIRARFPARFVAARSFRRRDRSHDYPPILIGLQIRPAHFPTSLSISWTGTANGPGNTRRRAGRPAGPNA